MWSVHNKKICYHKAKCCATKFRKFELNIQLIIYIVLAIINVSVWHRVYTIVFFKRNKSLDRLVWTPRCFLFGKSVSVRIGPGHLRVGWSTVRPASCVAFARRHPSLRTSSLVPRSIQHQDRPTLISFLSATDDDDDDGDDHHEDDGDVDDRTMLYTLTTITCIR